MEFLLLVFSAVILKVNTEQHTTCSKDNCAIIGASPYLPIFTNSSEIVEVKFFSSDLETFPNQLLDAYPELRKCDISNSMVQHLDIKKVTKLEWLDASKNQISELSVETLKNIPGIVSLYLSRNRITDLKENLFDDLKDLEVLDLSHNRITFLDVDAFNNLTSLQSLHLNHNHLTEFYIHLSRADNLKEIHGNNNQIKSIEISPRAELEVLLIRNNLLTDIRNITEIVSIQVLDISSNPIQSIEEHSFHNMTNLIHLSLRNTGLLIPKIFLPAQGKLTYLDISENRIRYLDFGSLKYLINLQTLKIENCSIKRIENYADQKEILPALRSISFDGNKLPCSFTVKFLNQCLKNEIEFLSDPIPTDKKSLNILGISCIGIEELEEDKRWEDQLTVAPEFNKSLLNSSIEPDKQKKPELNQWQGLGQPKMVPELSKSPGNISIEGEGYKDKNKTQSSVLDQPKMAPELNEEIGKPSMEFKIQNYLWELLGFLIALVTVAIYIYVFATRKRSKFLNSDSVINTHGEYQLCERSS